MPYWNNTLQESKSDGFLLTLYKLVSYPNFRIFIIQKRIMFNISMLRT